MEKADKRAAKKLRERKVFAKKESKIDQILLKEQQKALEIQK